MTLLFDWDGTLCDAAHLGLAAPPKNGGGSVAARRGAGGDMRARYYGDTSARLVEGARETLLRLYQRGYRMGVVSGGGVRRVVRQIDETGISSVFQSVVCAEDVVNQKPHPEALEKIMHTLGSPPSLCSYVGDSPIDVLMGRRAGVLTVGLRSTYPSSKHLRNAEPDIYLESVTELLRHF